MMEKVQNRALEEHQGKPQGDPSPPSRAQQEQQDGGPEGTGSDTSTVPAHAALLGTFTQAQISALQKNQRCRTPPEPAPNPCRHNKKASKLGFSHTWVTRPTHELESGKETA